jgi:hypothetical protein
MERVKQLKGSATSILNSPIIGGIVVPTPNEYPGAAQRTTLKYSE